MLLFKTVNKQIFSLPNITILIKQQFIFFIITYSQIWSNNWCDFLLFSSLLPLISYGLCSSFILLSIILQFRLLFCHSISTELGLVSGKYTLQIKYKIMILCFCNGNLQVFVFCAPFAWCPFLTSCNISMFWKLHPPFDWLNSYLF